MKGIRGRKLRVIPQALFLAIASIVVAMAPSANNQSIAFSQRARPPESSAGLPQSTSQKGHLKMDSGLSDLLAAYKQGGPVRVKDFADSRGIALASEMTRVVVETSASETEAAIKAAEALGATLETTYERFAQMSVPVPTLGSLADLPQVSFVRRPYLAKPLKMAAPAVIGEGLSVIGADAWHKAGITGKGVKVGLVDLGFDGHQSLLGTELPAKVISRSFRISKDITGQRESHGTSLAEIVYDVAPDAELYLANFETDIEFANAVTWLINSKVDIISCSIGWFNAGPADGTGPINDVVTNARENFGILWFNAAGNEAETHWGGKWADPEGDTYLNFSGGSNFNSLYAIGGSFITLSLSWDDRWGYSDNDYDMYLYDNTYREVANSLNWQRGTEAPTEFINFFVTTTGFYHIGIKKYDTRRDAKFSLFSSGFNLKYKTPEGSLTVPADTKAAIAVGAANYLNDRLESFSSQGPTTDGRTKPDIAAPDGISTATYGPKNFFGTSAAAPYAASAAALLKSAYPKWDAARIQAQLESSAKPLGNFGKNNQYGAGRLSLGLPPAGPGTVTPTPSGTVTPTATPGPRTPTVAPTVAPTATPAPKVNWLFLPLFTKER
ncbi:MAG: S8 family serine peptidase [Chloroflexi bacterium]|nr:S8 family serine peptidase [Chloroflexota bacterium]